MKQLDVNIQDNYGPILKQLILEEISIYAFLDVFFEIFRRDGNLYNDDSCESYKIIEELFYDADRFTDNEELLEKEPSYFVSKQEFYYRVKLALIGLSKISGSKLDASIVTNTTPPSLLRVTTNGSNLREA